jgi:hypothetical protein
MFWNRKKESVEHLVVAENVVPTFSNNEGHTKSIVKQLTKTLEDRKIPTNEQVD